VLAYPYDEQKKAYTLYGWDGTRFTKVEGPEGRKVKSIAVGSGGMLIVTDDALRVWYSPPRVTQAMCYQYERERNERARIEALRWREEREERSYESAEYDAANLLRRC